MGWGGCRLPRKRCRRRRRRNGLRQLTGGNGNRRCRVICYWRILIVASIFQCNIHRALWDRTRTKLDHEWLPQRQRCAGGGRDNGKGFEWHRNLERRGGQRATRRIGEAIGLPFRQFGNEAMISAVQGGKDRIQNIAFKGKWLTITLDLFACGKFQFFPKLKECGENICVRRLIGNADLRRDIKCVSRLRRFRAADGGTAACTADEDHACDCTCNDAYETSTTAGHDEISPLCAKSMPRPTPSMRQLCVGAPAPYASVMNTRCRAKITLM